jgi:hypothetical protein
MAEKRPWGGSPPPAERTRLLDRVARGPQPGDRRLQPLGPGPERVAGAFAEALPSELRRTQHARDNTLSSSYGALESRVHQRFRSTGFDG